MLHGAFWKGQTQHQKNTLSWNSHYHYIQAWLKSWNLTPPNIQRTIPPLNIQLIKVMDTYSLAYLKIFSHRVVL